MKLHEDTAAFKQLLKLVHRNSGIRTDVLEKDYYVTLILRELSDKQGQGLQAYFKGGTALYKALKTTNRFSEDIDLSVDVRGCTRTQGDKRLAMASKKYGSLTRNVQEGHTNRSEVVTVYDYSPLAGYDADDALQRFGRVKIEATSFTISEPVEKLMVAPMLYEFASDNQKQILESRYDIKPFPVMTISIERAFVDKLFAAEAYSRKADDPHKAFETAKHIYDLAVLERVPRIQALYKDNILLSKLLNIRMKEETARLDGIPGVVPQKFTFFDLVGKNNAIARAYDIMQKQYVLQSSDRIDFKDAVNALRRIHEQLEHSPAWAEYHVPSNIEEKNKERNAENVAGIRHILEQAGYDFSADGRKRQNALQGVLDSGQITRSEQNKFLQKSMDERRIQYGAGDIIARRLSHDIAFVSGTSKDRDRNRNNHCDENDDYDEI